MSKQTEVPPIVVVAAIALIVLVVGSFLYFGTNPGRQAKDMEAAINATVSKPGAKVGSPTAPGLPDPETSQAK